MVREMHDKSGLTDEVRASTVTLAEAEDMIMAYVTSLVPDPRTAPLCGNSIATDRGFLARDMPALDHHLHYRMIDVSSIKELCRRWYPRTYFGQPAKGLAHRALADIQESIRELEYYRRTVFVPPARPGRRDGQGDRRRGRRGPPDRLSRSRPGRSVPNPVDGDPGGAAIIGRRDPPRLAVRRMVAVAQLVEHRVVVPGVEGSSPFSHPLQRHRSAPASCGADLSVEPHGAELCPRVA